jgi:type I restriction enzyme S subunit
LLDLLDLLVKNDFAYNPSRLNIGSIAYFDKEGKGLISPMYVVFHADESKILAKYLFIAIKSEEVRNKIDSLKEVGARFRFDFNRWDLIQIPLPSLSEQQRIVDILDKFTDSIENMKEQIAQRRKQYEYYRDQLLDLEGKEGVEMKKLLDVLAQPITDGPHETPSFYEYGIPFISADAIVDNKINFSRKRGYISEEYDLLCQKKYKPQLNDIYLVKSGSTTGKVAIVRTEERFNIWSPLAAIRVNQSNHPYFVYYMLQTKKVQDQVKLKCSQGSQPNLSMRVLENFVIPVPSLSEQQRIVSILDTFEASIRNLEQQLALREKQYEYYRNKLLTFEQEKN